MLPAESVPVFMNFLKKYRYSVAVVVITVLAAEWLLTRPFLFGQTKEGFLFIQRAEPGMPVVMAYMHSAMRTPIEETLLINENSDGLILKQLRYRTYGAGLPYLASEGRFREENGWFILDDMDRRFREVSIRNGVINNGTLTVGNTLYRLPNLMPLGSELRLYIAPLYRGFWMKKEMR